MLKSGYQMTVHFADGSWNRSPIGQGGLDSLKLLTIGADAMCAMLSSGENPLVRCVIDRVEFNDLEITSRTMIREVTPN